VIVERVEPLRREELPAAAYVHFLVIDLRLRTRVVVIDGAHVEAEVTEGLLPAPVEVHFDVAARVARALAHVRVPVAEVDAACMAVIEAALDGRLTERLVDAAKPVLGSERDVSGERRRGRRRLLRLRIDRRRSGCGERDWYDELTH